MSVESSRAARAARAGSPAAQTPIGDTRISEPFDSLSVVCMAEQAALGGGADVDRARGQPFAVGVEHFLGIDTRFRARCSAPARAPSRCRRSAGRRWCGTRRRRPARARRRERAARSRRAALNSTSEPRLSPITWPSRQPCARASAAGRALRGKPSVTRASRRGSVSSSRPVERARAAPRPRARRRSSRITRRSELARRARSPGPRRRAPRRPRRAQRHAGGDVVFVHAVRRHRGHAVAGGDARQAVGDARHRDVARGRDRARPGAGAIRRRGGGEHEFARGEQALRQIDVERLAVAQQRAGALGPGDGVRAAVGRERAMHHAEDRGLILHSRQTEIAEPRRPPVNSLVPSCGSTSQPRPGRGRA